MSMRNFFLSAIESIFLSNDCAKLFNYLYLYDKYHYKYPIEEKTIDNAFSFIYNVLKTTIKDQEKQTNLLYLSFSLNNRI